MAEQQEEGLLEKIHALVAPPQSTSSKQKGKKGRVLPTPSTPSTQKHGGIENNPFCHACGDGGNLLCCDNCPASFHFYCCDPPVDPKNLPSGEWLCRSCASIAPDDTAPHLFRPLLEQASTANPLIFNIPEELKCHDLLPGQSKKHVSQRGKTEDRETSLRFCFACNQKVHPADMAQCDFCPIHFHLSCVDPPLTTLPSTAWMCPVHPHHCIPDLEHPRLSRRLRALEKGQEEIQHHHIKMDFLSKINRIPHYKRVARHLKRRVAKVPPALKSLYSSPMPEVCETPPLSESLVCAAEVCHWWRGEEGRRRREFAAVISSSSQLPPTHNQDQWTRRAVLCQLGQDTCPPTQPPPSSTPHPHSSSSSCSSHPVTHHHNSHMGHESSDKDRVCDDSAAFIAATQLLELSKRQPINGVVKSLEIYKPKQDNYKLNSAAVVPTCDQSSVRLVSQHSREEERVGIDGSPEKKSDVHVHTCVEEREVVGVRVNGCSELVREEEEGERRGDKGGGGMSCEAERMEVEAGGRVENGEMVTGEFGDGVRGDGLLGEGAGGVRHRAEGLEIEAMETKNEGGREGGGEEGGELCSNESEEEARMEASGARKEGGREEEEGNLFVPDITLLDPRLVHLLATQRLQQLFTPVEEKITGPSPSQSNQLLSTKTINGMKSILLPKPANPILTAESLKSSQSVLCPVSGIGTVFPVHKQVTLIGIGFGVDVCLSHYGHCNYLSPRHACIFYNKVTGEYELLNYSDHGSVVDGVLYSCDFSDKAVVEVEKKETSPLADSALPGFSVKRDKAKIKIETARESLRDQASARRALEGALSLSKHSGKDEGAGEGARRTTYNSSVVSIPLTLSRAKKLSAGVPGSTMNDAKPSTPSSVPGTPEKLSSDSLLKTLSVCPDPLTTPCLCRRSASCLVGTNRKGWEGTATLYHGSRLRFGCLQFVFSIAGRPGHTELLDSLFPLLMLEHT